jgi:Leucine-rich repeat (LRR) protein
MALFNCSSPTKPSQQTEDLEVNFAIPADTALVNDSLLFYIKTNQVDIVDSIQINCGDNTFRTYCPKETLFVFPHKYTSENHFKIVVSVYTKNSIHQIFDSIVIIHPVKFIDKNIHVLGSSEISTPLVMSLTASGSKKIGYRWFKNDSLMLSYDSTSINFTSLDENNNGTYFCIADNIYSFDTSYTYTIRVIKKLPEIIDNKSTMFSGNAISNARCVLYVKVSKPELVNYQWYKDSLKINNNNNDTLIFEKLKPSDSGSYYCIVSNSVGADTSKRFYLSIIDPVQIEINKQIQTKGKSSYDSTLVLYVVTSGTQPVFYNWFKNDVLLSGANSATLTLPKLTTSDNGIYYCKVMNSVGSDSSLPFTLSIDGVFSPVIQNNKSIVVSGKPYKDSLLNLSVISTGTIPLTYNWHRVGESKILSASSNLQFDKISESLTGIYYCIVKNDLGADTSLHYSVQLINHKPVIVRNDTIKIKEDPVEPGKINIIASDKDGDTLFWNIISGSFNGDVELVNSTISSNPECTYKPHADYYGIDSLFYIVNDGKDSSDTMVFYISIQPVNDIPEILDVKTSVTINEDDSIALSVNLLSIKDIDNIFPNDFSLIIYNGDNYTHKDLQIKPNLNYNGLLYIPVSVNDGTDNSKRFIFKINVLPVNDLPTLTLTSPVNNEKKNFGSPVTLTFAVNEVEGIKKASYKIDDSTCIVDPEDGSFTFSKNIYIPFSDSVVGKHKIYVSIEDSSGAIMDTTVSVTINGTYTSDSLTVMKILDINKVAGINKAVNRVSSKIAGRVRYYFTNNINNMSIIPKCIQNLSHLDSICLQGDTITDVSENIGNLTSVKTLAFYDCLIDSLQMEKIYSCKSIINLLDSGAMPVTHDIGKLINLEKIIIENNPLFSIIPESMGNLKKLRLLKIKDCNEFISISEGFSGCINLDSLRIHNCNTFNKLPSDFVNLPNLRYLYINSTNLSKFPAISSGNLPKLKDLSFVLSPIDSIDASLFLLPGLKNLIVYACPIKNFPTAITSSNIEYLDFFDTCIDTDEDITYDWESWLLSIPRHNEYWREIQDCPN